MDKFLIRTTGKISDDVNVEQPEPSSSGVQKTTFNESDDTEAQSDYSKSETSESCYSDSDDSKSEDKRNKTKQNPTGAKKRKIYKPKYNKYWKNEFEGWLQESSEHTAFCKACQKIVQGGKSHLRRHENTNYHKKRIAGMQAAVRIEPVIRKSTRSTDTAAKEAELKLVMCIAEHNLPFMFLEHAPKLIQSMCHDSEIAKKIKCSRTKGTKITTEILGPASTEEVATSMKSGKFSLIIDETTDVSTNKCLAVIVRYFDKRTDTVRDRFLTLLDVESCTAESLHNAVINFLRKENIPIENMIGFAADNASVMMGNFNGVQARFRESLPHLFVMGCIYHSFHLCASAACLKLPKTVEDLCRDVYLYFCNSSKRLTQFKECQEYANLKPHKILRPSQTRWLSLQAVVNRMLEQWPSLTLFFSAAALEDNVQAAHTILNALNNPVYKLYYAFLSYVLEQVNRLNLLFQGERPLLHILLPRITEVFRTLLKNFMDANYVIGTPVEAINPRAQGQYLSLDLMYIGVSAEMIANSNVVPMDDLHNFRLRALDFYIELCMQIKSRVKFDDPVLSFIQNLEPKVALSGSIPSLVPIMQLFPNIVSTNDREALNAEWRLLPEMKKTPQFTAERGKELTLEDFMKVLRSTHNGLGQLMFPQLAKFFEAIVCLPHSSAAAERAFSQLNLIKTKTRNRLLVDTCSALLQTKELLHGDSCYSWKPDQKMLTQCVLKQLDSVETLGNG